MPAIGVMLWMASPSSVTGVVSHGVIGTLLRSGSANIDAGSQAATISRTRGCQVRTASAMIA